MKSVSASVARVRRGLLGRLAPALLVGAALALPLGGCGAAPTVKPKAAAAATKPAKHPKHLTAAQIAAGATPSVVTIRSNAGMGTGFVVRREGWIATNLHVIAGARHLVVALADGDEYEVTHILATDETHDLALLAIDAEDLSVLPLGESDVVSAGDAVVAIGNPLGLEHTVSNGLVSAIRDVNPTLSILQISAPISPGSSGGPLINDQGEVIGIATAVARGGQNLAFGIPVNYLKRLFSSVDPVPFEEFAATVATPPPPTVKRSVPKHAVALLAGCGEGDLRLVAGIVADAGQSAFAMYEEGNASAGYHLSEGATLDAERRIGARCLGVRKALSDGRRKAASLSDPVAQIWTMRDTFEGLLDVIDRKLRGVR